jgi:integral membrane protein (TIGR01906 family)
MGTDITPQEVVKKSKPTTSFPYYQVLSWIVTIFVPVLLVLTSVRLLLKPVFLPLEYNTPGFPVDTYGFTIVDRLYWSRISQEYLVNKEGISFLADLRFPDGSSVYNQRELQHMVDVKEVVRKALSVWYSSLGCLLLLGIWAWRRGWFDDYRLGLSRGGFLTALLIFIIILFVIASFRVIFVAFHQVFFVEGTWVFNYSDTLIRLFPERFWRDIFIYLGALSLVGGLVLGFGLRPKKQ